MTNKDFPKHYNNHNIFNDFYLKTDIDEWLKRCIGDFPDYSIDEYGLDVNLPNWSLEVIEWKEKWFKQFKELL